MSSEHYSVDEVIYELRAENQRLREALKLIASGHGPPPKEQAREALAGDAE
jgi:hypothetical protein